MKRSFKRLRSLRGGFISRLPVSKIAQLAKTGLSGYPKAHPAVNAVNYVATRWSKPGQFEKDIHFVKQGLSGVKAVAKNITNPQSVVKGSLFAPVIYNNSGSVTKSDYVLGSHSRYESKLDQKFVLNKMDSYRQICVLGKQSVQSYQVLDGYEISKIFLDLNNAGAGLTTAGSNAASRIYYSSAHCTMRMTNSSNMSLLVHIYECEPSKYTISTAPTTGYPQAQYCTSPVAAWNYGENIQYPNASMPYGTNPSYEDVGSRPFNIDGFNQFWRVREVQQVELTPGSTHVHNSVYNINSMFYSAELIPAMMQVLGDGVPSFSVNTGTYQGNIIGSLPGFTKSVMIVMSGLPVHDKTTITNITTSSTSLDIVKTSVFKVRTRFANNVVIATKNNLPAVTDANAEQYIVQTPTDTTVSTH